jgi:predicted DNA-binding transcriptional regulator AlpA
MPIEHLDTASGSCYTTAVADTSKWMTIKEAVEHLGISRSALYDAIGKGDIRRMELLGAPVVRRSDVLRYKPRPYPRRIDAGNYSSEELKQAIADRLRSASSVDVPVERIEDALGSDSHGAIRDWAATFAAESGYDLIYKEGAAARFRTKASKKPAACPPAPGFANGLERSTEPRTGT